jgi:hypothetical protein
MRGSLKSKTRSVTYAVSLRENIYTIKVAASSQKLPISNDVLPHHLRVRGSEKCLIDAAESTLLHTRPHSATPGASTCALFPKQYPSPMPQFYKANASALLKAIEESATSRSKIASLGGLSAETLKRAIGGERVIPAKADGIVKGLKACGVPAVKAELFIET